MIIVSLMLTPQRMMSFSDLHSRENTGSKNKSEILTRVFSHATLVAGALTQISFPGFLSHLTPTSPSLCWGVEMSIIQYQLSLCSGHSPPKLLFLQPSGCAPATSWSDQQVND